MASASGTILTLSPNATLGYVINGILFVITGC